MGDAHAIESGCFQREIGESAYRDQRQVDSKERIIVGVNAYQEVNDLPPELLNIDPRWEREHLARLQKIRAERDNALASERLQVLRRAADGDTNLMPAILDCVRAYCSLGEIVDALRSVFGEYRDQPII